MHRQRVLYYSNIIKMTRVQCRTKLCAYIGNYCMYNRDFFFFVQFILTESYESNDNIIVFCPSQELTRHLYEDDNNNEA